MNIKSRLQMASLIPIVLSGTSWFFYIMTYIQFSRGNAPSEALSFNLYMAKGFTISSLALGIFLALVIVAISKFKTSKAEVLKDE